MAGGQVRRAVDALGSASDRTFTHDGLGRLTAAVVGGASVSYALDAFGRITSRTQGGTTETFAYEGTGPDLVRRVRGASTTDYAWTPAGPLAERTGTQVLFYLRDLHGDAVGTVAPGAGTPTSRAYGSPFGELTWAGQAPALGFQSQYTDPTTGWVATPARWYVPSLARFASPDPLPGDPADPLSLNRYAYAEDDPLTLWDPSGLRAQLAHGEGCGRACLLEPVEFDPGEYQTWTYRHLQAIYFASEAFDVPPSVIAGVLAVEHEYDARGRWKSLGEWFSSKVCGAPLVGSWCDGVPGYPEDWPLAKNIRPGLSFGAGQVQLRRAELVDQEVRALCADGACDEALGSRRPVCTKAGCVVVGADWGSGMGALIGRLRNEETNILYVAAYMDLLRDSAPESWTWRGIYRKPQPVIGSYNANPLFARAFAKARRWYGYLDL